MAADPNDPPGRFRHTWNASRKAISRALRKSSLATRANFRPARCAAASTALFPAQRRDS